MEQTHKACHTCFKIKPLHEYPKQKRTFDGVGKSCSYCREKMRMVRLKEKLRQVVGTWCERGVMAICPTCGFEMHPAIPDAMSPHGVYQIRCRSCKSRSLLIDVVEPV